MTNVDTILWFVLTYCAVSVYSQNYVVVFEKGELNRYDKETGRVGEFNFRKYNRTTFVLNTNFVVIRDVDLNKVLVRLEASKFYSNKYVTVPTKLNLMLCKAWKDNFFGIRDLATSSDFKLDSCFIPKNSSYRFVNYMPNFKYPPYAPLGKYRIDINVELEKRNLCSMSWFVHLDPK